MTSCGWAVVDPWFAIGVGTTIGRGCFGATMVKWLRQDMGLSFLLGAPGATVSGRRAGV